MPLLNRETAHRLPQRLNTVLLHAMEYGTRRGRRWSLSVILLLIFLVGWTDYLVDVRVSLAPFYIPILLLSVVWLGWVSAVVWAFMCVVVRVSGDLAAGGYMIPWTTVFWNRIADFATYLIIIGMLQALVTLMRELEARVHQCTEALEKSLEDRQDLQRQLFDISRRERSTIGHELHDGLGQHLTATSMAAKLVSDRLVHDGHPVAENSRNLVRMILDAINQTRQIARGLLLAAVEPDELLGVLDELALNLRQENHLVCSFSIEGSLPKLSVSQSSHLYYIIQEAARNAMRHGKPRSIAIVLKGDVQSLTATVTDDGQGFRPGEAVHPGMGLKIMAHRAELIGAVFSCEALQPQGTRICCHLALSPEKLHPGSQP